jgi:MFS family permease
MSWRIVPLLMLVVLLAHFNRVSITVAGAEQIIRPDYVSETEMGTVYSSFLLLYTIFMMPGGLFIDRFGPRVAWMVLGFGAAIGVGLTGLVGLTCTEAATLLAGLLVVRSLLGIAYSPLHPGGARLVANWVPPTGIAMANGLVTFAACVGIAATYVVFGMLMDQFGWPLAFLITSGVTLVVAVVWTVSAADHPAEAATSRLSFHSWHSQPSALRKASGPFLPSSHREEEIKAKEEGITVTPPAPLPPANHRDEDAFSARTAGFLALLGNRRLVCLALSYGAVGYFQYLFFYWANYYFEKVLHWSKEASRRNTSLLILAMGAGMVLGGWLADWAIKRLGSRGGLAVVPILGLVVAAATNVVGVFASDSVVILGSLGVAMAAIGACEGPFWTASVRIGGTRGGTAAAILNTGGNGGGLLAPVLTPIMAAAFGWEAALVLASGVCILGAVLWWGVVAGGGFEQTRYSHQGDSPCAL